MLTKGDEYPIHQTAEPIAYSGTDRNFYDRYFFNGYGPEGENFFAVALGVYPHLNIMDASFCVIDDGIEHALHASRILGMERLDVQVGPISVDIVEPLVSLRVRVGKNEHGIEADLTFTRRAVVIEEPRFTYRSGPRTVMDYTRMTQNGTWSGWISIKGKRIEISPDRFLGTRDRSWGIRPVGAADSQPVAPPPPPQFYWLWAPLNFDDCITLYHNNADADGEPWNTNAVLCPTGEGAPEEMEKCSSVVTFKSGTRHAQAAELNFERRNGERIRIELTPQYNFYMFGLGYTHPEWGHGHFKGESALGYEEIDIAAANPTEFHHLHVQAFSKARMTLEDGTVKNGRGILEQLIIGPHKPSGFNDLLDMAP